MNHRIKVVFFFALSYFSNIKSFGQNTIIKTFYDKNLQILTNTDTLNASYYRIVTYRDGNIVGPLRDYYGSGKVMMEGYYSGNNISKGHEHGKFTWYYENGNIFQTCLYLNGLLEGVYIEYYPSGSKKMSVTYSQGKRYGCEYAWDEEGTVTHRAFVENEKLYKRQDCDTTYIDRASQIDERSMGLKDVFLQEYADGEYKSFDSSLFYKSKKIRVLSVTLTNENKDIVSASNIKPGQYISICIRVTGIVSKNNLCLLRRRTQEFEPGDKGGGGAVGTNYCECKSEIVEIRLGGSTQMIYDRELSVKHYCVFFYIEDMYSDASIHGFYRYKLKIEW